MPIFLWNRLRHWQKVCLALPVLGLAGLACALAYFYARDAWEPSRLAYQEHCAACHGMSLQGTAAAPSLLAQELTLIDDHESLMVAMSGGDDVPPFHDWRTELPAPMVKAVALYIAEQQQEYRSTAASYGFDPQADGHVDSEQHGFTVERVSVLKSRPYGLIALPEGRLLVTEKTRGVSIIERDGQQGPPLSGAPQVWNTVLSVQGAWLNWGIMLDIALHPDYESNGWIYLSHTDRCWLKCGSLLPTTMVRVLRGRIRGNSWVDQEVVWSVHRDHYTPVPDGVAAGRLAFDHRGYLYISIGGKNTYDKLHNLDTPFGKIHRVHDDGRVPADNPFFVEEGKRDPSSTRHTVWSIGHRTGQGLATHPHTGSLWNTEMGPRGGDEINLIRGGGNYGWPLYTSGLDYDSTYISIGEDLGLDFPLEETELPVVDFTPAPALSNLSFYEGAAFPKWNGDALVGSLKAGSLYRVRLKTTGAPEVERLLVNFGRIRDVAVGPSGEVYLAVEHGENGSLWRLSPLP